MSLRSMRYRVYSDYFMPCRMNEYKDLVEKFVCQGYETHSIISFWRLLVSGADVTKGKYLLLRHDVDINPAAAEEMWRIEQDLGAKSSFYFRLSTMDLELMKRIEDSGSEASYHYEEIATIIKQRRLRTKDDVLKCMPEIQRLFWQNYTCLKHKSGLPMASVASHGDFTNRILSIPNWYLLQSSDLRKKLRIEVETYDRELMKYVIIRYSDALYPNLRKPNNPEDAIGQGASVVYILTHPGRWKRSVALRIRHDVTRLVEGFNYHILGVRV